MKNVLKKLLLGVMCFAAVVAIVTITGCDKEDVENDGASYVDLGLPSGTLWKSTNEEGLYNYDSAVETFGSKLPISEQIDELRTHCQWVWDEQRKGCMVIGENKKSIFMPAAGINSCGIYYVGTDGYYWSSTILDIGGPAIGLSFYKDGVSMIEVNPAVGMSVRLVKN